MNEESMAFEQAVKDAAETARFLLPDHPETEVLIAYQERRLAAGASAEIREHLALCPECAQLVLDLGNFPQVPLRDASLALSAEEEEEDLGLLVRRLAQRKPEPLPEPVPLRPTTRRWQPPGWLLAASLAVAAAGLGMWLTGVPSPFAGPGGDVEAGTLLDLYPVEAGTRGGTVDEIAPIPEGDTPLVLLLNTAGLGDFAAYEVEIRSGDALALRRAGLEPGPKGTFTLVVPRSRLPAGGYEILLFGSPAAGGRAESARYRVPVRYGDPP